MFRNYAEEAIVNIGCGQELTIHGLKEGYGGVVDWLQWQPGVRYLQARDTPGRLLDAKRLNGLGVRPRDSLKVARETTYGWSECAICFVNQSQNCALSDCKSPLS